ncbi:ribonuclease domain-containing protein [Chryseobacterium sp. T1]
MNPKLKTFLIFFFGALAGIGTMYILKPKKPQVEISLPKVDTVAPIVKKKFAENKIKDSIAFQFEKKESKKNNRKPYEIENKTIDELTEESIVIDFLKKHQKLPNYYITKKEAREQGWEPGKGNLCDTLPGKAIGGDKFGNREKNLPMRKGRQYYEADLNYKCSNRNADRVVFSNDGLIFVSHDHYQTFQQK